MDLFYGTNYYDRERGNLPSFPVINMFAEQAPVEKSVVLQSRPGLKNQGTTFGAGPVTALYQIDGVLSGDLFGISDNKLYRSSSLLGSLDGSGPAHIAAFENILFVNQGKSVYSYDGTTFAPVALPDGFEVIDIAVGASRLVVVDKGTGKFYWSDALTSNVDALSFATAENTPDNLKACLYIGDTLILFGSETIEFWPVSTDPDAPYQPLVGRVFQTGIRDTGCAVEFRGTFAWITNSNQVCVQDPTNIISNIDLEAKLANSPNAALWKFFLDGTEFLAVRIDNHTFVYNSRSKAWSEFQSYGLGNFLPQCSVGDLMGSAVDGHILEWSDDHTDFGDILERRFRAGTPLEGSSVIVTNVSLRTNPGQTPYEDTGYFDPQIELRTSRDGGFAFSPWKAKALGLQGKYRQNVQWRSLGAFSSPGVMMEFRVTDPVPFRVSGVMANVPYGGI
jgi:hypothetical protein